MTRYGYTYQPDTCPEHSFGSNDGQPVDDHCSRCGILWSERERAARAEKHCSVCNGPLPKFGYGRLGPPMCDACQRDTRARKREQRAANAASARRARVISGTGDSGERRELAALVRGLRGE